jgi:hypothetical protein
MTEPTKETKRRRLNLTDIEVSMVAPTRDRASHLGHYESAICRL